MRLLRAKEKKKGDAVKSARELLANVRISGTMCWVGCFDSTDGSNVFEYGKKAVWKANYERWIGECSVNCHDKFTAIV